MVETLKVTVEPFAKLCFFRVSQISHFRSRQTLFLRSPASKFTDRLSTSTSTAEGRSACESSVKTPSSPSTLNFQSIFRPLPNSNTSQTQSQYESAVSRSSHHTRSAVKSAAGPLLALQSWILDQSRTLEVTRVPISSSSVIELTELGMCRCRIFRWR